jgi:hypothetical protein
MCIFLLLTALLFGLSIPCLAGDGPPADDPHADNTQTYHTDALVDQLFSEDAGQRTAARTALLTRKDADLKKILARIESRQPAKALLQIYDVSDLKADIQKWPGVSVLIKDAADGAKTFQYDPERGVVIVMGSEGVHQKIAERLNALRRLQGKLVQVQAWFVETKKPVADLPAELTEDAVQALVDRIGGKLVSSPRLVCRSGQSATIEMIENVSFIEDFDVEVANGTCILDPVVGIVQSGVTVEVRPFLAKNGTVQLATTARKTKIELPFPTLTLPTITGQKAEIQIPTLETVATVKLMTCRPNHAALIKLGDGMIVILSATSLQLPDDEDPEKQENGK